ncbi:MAG: beta strand repeat-containing protein, partial [Flavobacteriales bacterium]
MRFWLTFILFFSLIWAPLRAQYCTPATSTLAITPTSTLQYTPYYTTGVPAFSFIGTAGCSYTFSTCGESTNDTYLRLHNAAFALLGQWDDQCSLQSTFTWTCPTTGTYYVHLSRFVCNPLTATTRMSYISSCPNTPCTNPVVNAGADVTICAGASTTLAGSITAGSGGGTGSAGPLTININSAGWLDFTSWTMTNASGTQIGFGGPYGFGSNNTVTIASPGAGPYSFFLETQGAILDNTANYSISCNGTTVNSGTLAPGLTTTVSVTGCTGSTGTPTPTFVWTPSTGLSATNVLNPLATPSVTTTYTLTATQGTCVGQDQVTVFVNPIPSVTGTSQTFCPGSAVTLSATGTPSGGSFLWSPGGQTTNTITVSPTATTAYNVQYTVGGCSSNSTVNATQINGLDFVNVQAPGNSNICEGQSVNIYGQVYEAGLTEPTGQAAGITVQYAISTVNTNPATWPASAWSSATYNPLSLLNPNNDEYQATLSNLAPGTYYYAFSYTYNGCTVYGGYSSTGGGTWNGTTNLNGVLVVNPNVAPNFSPISAICAGSSFPTLPTSSINNITGTWSPAPNNLQTTTYTFTPTIGLCALTATLTVAVNPLPTLSITNATNTTVLTCTQTSIALTAVGSGAFAWANGVIPISTGSSLNVTAPGTYTLGILDQNGCTATTSVTITQNITVPTAIITTAPNTQVLTCSTPSITLNGAGGGTYSWSNGASTFSTSNSANITTPGTYTLAVTGTNGCIDTEVISITQNIAPPVAVIQNTTGSNTLNCNTTAILLNASGGVSYSWSNGTTVLGSSSNLTVTAAGTYTVTVTGANGCTDTESITITFQANTNPVFNQIAPICAGGSFVLPTNSTNGVNGSWSPAANFFATTTYTFTPIIGSCANPVTMTIIVNPYPVITAQNDTICAGSVGTITTQVSIPNGTYSWAPLVNNLATLSISPSFTNSYQVIYNVAGCTDTAFASIIVKPVPVVNTQNASICAGQSGTISATANLANGSFLWSNGSTNPNQTLSPVATTNYTVVYTLDGCSSIPATATITVLPVPTNSVKNTLFGCARRRCRPTC